MERMEIKLKNCCLTCEHFSAWGSAFGVCTSDKREISCSHMPVCYKYKQSKRTIKEIVFELLEKYEISEKKRLYAVGYTEEEMEEFRAEIEDYKSTIDNAQT